ncbi:MAG TPA: lamin tail domain-containing protein, partial [Chitinophagaceae bacterium]
INISGWRLKTSTSTSGAFPSYTLPADSFLILVTSSQVTNFASFGRVIAVPSFPAIPNDGSMLSLVAPNGSTIHAVEYTAEWYGNEVKKNGGWSLEMIDTHNPCTGINNWKASTDANGGSPGKKNSVEGVNPDNEAPRLLRSYSNDSLTIVLVFDEPLDIPSASIASQYSISNGLTIISAFPLSPLFNSVVLTLNAPMQRRVVYEVTANSVKDCKGNAIGVYNKSKAGWGEEAFMNDIVINEILFNPRPNAEDFLELYNRSNKVIDASKLFIANRSSTGAISSLKKISETAYHIYPGEYIVLTGNIPSLQMEYHVKQPSSLIPLSLPSFPDDKGIAVLLNLQGEVVDELNYDENWHFKLISNAEGISLERLDSELPTQSKDNWHSAASTAGYATPTYQNSQYKQMNAVGATVEVSPKVFSPDNDGYDDVATVSYKLNEPGYVANITIFDASGRVVRNLVRNGSMGLRGMWRWDGLGEKNQKLPIGNYIIYTEIFNLQGKKQQFKQVITLARRLK